MPRTRKYTKRSKKNFRKRTKKSGLRFSGQNLSLTSAGSLPLPKTYMAKLRYMEKDIAVDAGLAGVAGDYVFNLNSIFDPNVTSTGHQPAGFDQFMTLYKYYTVVGAKAHVVFQNTDASHEALCATYINTEATPITDLRRLVESGNCSYNFLTKTGGSRDIWNTTAKVSMKKVLGITNIMDDEECKANAAANPVKKVFMHCVSQPNSTNNPAPVGLAVVIDFYVVFSEPLLNVIN